MRWGNPFSFDGRIGRLQLWLTLIAVSIADGIVEAFPVSSHKVLLSTFGGFGESWISYVTPTEPITSKSWAFFVGFYLIAIGIFWVISAAAVKRLRDLDISGRWVAIFFGAVAANFLLEALFSHPHSALSTFDIFGLVLFSPVCLIGALGLFLMMWMPGSRNSVRRFGDMDLRKGTL